MDRAILHCDLNSFYASVEELYHPETRGLPIAVGGDVDKRHGIILARNQLAKKFGVQTAETIWQAKLKCPNLILYPPNYERYMLFSKRTREIFHCYTDLIEPFGIDEAWLDVTHSSIYGSGEKIADTIRNRISNELGVTASIGVSFNKVFAKLGSDLRKPNFTTIINKENMAEMVWPLKVENLLYVGKATQRKLNTLGIYTIGDLAHSEPKVLKRLLGKIGEMLWMFANGKDESPVSKYDATEIIKSIGNSVTCYRDLNSDKDLNVVMWVLAESVASRLRDQGLKAKGVAISLRDNELNCFSRQCVVANPINTASELMLNARKLYKDNYFWQKPLRSIGLKSFQLVDSKAATQLSLFTNQQEIDKEYRLEVAMDDIRGRYGFNSVKRASMLLDPALSDFNPKGDHIIFPENFLK